MTADIPSCSEIPDDFMPYYLMISTRKAFFLLDSAKVGKIKIPILASSAMIEELLMLKRLEQYKNEIDPIIYKQQVS